MDEAGQHSVSSFLPEFVRFGWLIYGDRDKAATAVIDATRRADAAAGDLRNDDVWRVWLFRELHRASLEEQHLAVAGPSILDQPLEHEAVPLIAALSAEDLVAFFQSLPLPRRGVFALFLINCFSSHELASVVELQTEEIAAELHQARLQLVKWTSSPQRN